SVSTPLLFPLFPPPPSSTPLLSPHSPAFFSSPLATLFHAVLSLGAAACHSFRTLHTHAHTHTHNNTHTHTHSYPQRYTQRYTHTHTAVPVQRRTGRASQLSQSALLNTTLCLVVSDGLKKTELSRSEAHT